MSATPARPHARVREHDPYVPMRMGAPRWLLLGLAALVSGSACHVIAYQTMAPPLLYVMLVLPLAGVVQMLSLRAVVVRDGFCFFAGLFWLYAGIGALIDGPVDIGFTRGQDWVGFYTLLMTQHVSWDLDEMRRLVNSPLAIAVWKTAYDVADGLGLPIASYIGTAVTTAAVATAATLTVAMTVTAAPGRTTAVGATVLMLCMPGSLAAFAALHIRDAFTTVIIALLGMVWMRFVVVPTGARLIAAVVLGALSAAPLFYLRMDFVVLPLTLAFVAIFSVVASPSATGPARRRKHLLGAIAVVAGSMAVAGVVPGIIEQMSYRTEQYAEFAEASTMNQASLGMALVVNQPFYIKMVLGPLYALFMPVPLWVAFGTLSVHDLTRMVYTIGHWLIVPILVAAGVTMVRLREKRSASLLFPLGVFGLLTVGVGTTSMEWRHLGTFYPFACVAAGLALQDRDMRRMSGRFVQISLLVAAIVHVAWFMLKA